MAMRLRYSVNVDQVGDGTGPMTPILAQTLNLQGVVQVPGGDTPTQANFNTAIGTTLTAALEAQIAANLTQIQGFASGNP